MLIIGIVYHVQFMLGLRDERKEMRKTGSSTARPFFRCRSL